MIRVKGRPFHTWLIYGPMVHWSTDNGYSTDQGSITGQLHNGSKATVGPFRSTGPSRSGIPCFTKNGREKTIRNALRFMFCLILQLLCNHVVQFKKTSYSAVSEPVGWHQNLYYSVSEPVEFCKDPIEKIPTRYPTFRTFISNLFSSFRPNLNLFYIFLNVC